MLASSASSMPADFSTSFPMLLQVSVGAPTQTMACGDTLNGCSHQAISSPAGLFPKVLPAMTAGASPIIEATASDSLAVHCSTSQLSVAASGGSGILYAPFAP